MAAVMYNYLGLSDLQMIVLEPKWLRITRVIIRIILRIIIRMIITIIIQRANMMVTMIHCMMIT